MDSHQLILYGILVVAVIALWLAFKVMKKIIIVMLVVVAVGGIALGIYFNIL